MSKHNKDTLVGVLIALSFYAVPIAAYMTFSERASVVGYTNIAGPGHLNPGTPNYAVFTKGRFVQVRTDLFAAHIAERDGKIVYIRCIPHRMLPVFFTSPATPEQEALWRQYFN